MSETSNDENMPLFMRTLLENMPAHLLEVPTSKLPAEVPQSLIDTLADQSKSEGDRLYRENKWQEARDAYMYGVGLRTSDPNVRKAILLNLAATDLQLKEWNAVLRDTSWALKIDPNSVKGLYRAARALAQQQCFEEALDCCDRALKIEPHNQPLREERRTARKEVIKHQQRLLSKAYQYHHLLINPGPPDAGNGPTTQSLMPYFDPPIPVDPTKATLFCSLSIMYPERCSVDYVADFPSDKPILPLLNTLLPGSTPLADAPSTRYNLVPTPTFPFSTPSLKHPTTWDPEYEFLSSKISIYTATRRKELIRVTGEMTLVDVCAEAKRMSPDPPDQEDAYRQDGEYIEITAGIIGFYGFRNGSRAEERFKNEDFDILLDLANPEYVASMHEAVLMDSRLRNFNYGSPNRPINDPSSLSFTAREGMLRMTSNHHIMAKKSKKSKAKSKEENTSVSTRGSSNPVGPPSGMPQSTPSDAIAEEARSEGNALYQQKKWLEARDTYMKGIGIQTSDPDLQKTLLLNLAAANLQLGNWADVLRDATTVIAMDSNSFKAHFRAARALNELKRFEEALDHCDRGLKLKPSSEPLKEARRIAENGSLKTQRLLLLKAYEYHRFHIVPTSRTNAFMSIPTTHPHELPYFDPPTPSDPFKAPLHCYVRFRYIERHASDTVSDYPMDKPILPLLNTFLPGSTKFASPSRSRNGLTFVPSGDDPNIKHPTSWDPSRQFLPSTLLVYARTGRGDTILVRGEMTLADIFGQVRQLAADNPDDDYIYLELKRGMVHLFAFRKDSETERRWNDGYFKDPADLGDPKYIVCEHVDSNTDLRSRHFSYDNTEARARGTNFITSLSWAAREGILQLLYMRSEEDESSSDLD